MQTERLQASSGAMRASAKPPLLWYFVAGLDQLHTPGALASAHQADSWVSRGFTHTVHAHTRIKSFTSPPVLQPRALVLSQAHLSYSPGRWCGLGCPRRARRATRTDTHRHRQEQTDTTAAITHTDTHTHTHAHTHARTSYGHPLIRYTMSLSSASRFTGQPTPASRAGLASARITRFQSRACAVTQQGHHPSVPPSAAKCPHKHSSTTCVSSQSYRGRTERDASRTQPGCRAHGNR